MEVKRAAEMDPEVVTGPVFETQVTKKTGFSESFDDKTLSVNEVIFAPGERTTPHSHTIRQVLYITGGTGVIASDSEEHVVSAGDMISIPPEEVHWHGASEGESFSHLSIVVRDPTHGGTVPETDD
jgi:quercetin dioxygenase-like cupin family protein